MSNLGAPQRDVHYVLEVKIQEVVHTTETARPGERGMGKPHVECVINEVAHYVVKEKIMKVLLTKGAKLLELSGE